MSADWQSSRAIRSEAWPRVVFEIRRMSFAGRLELMKKVRDLAGRADFFEAGQDEKNRMEASLLGAEIDRLYLDWGLKAVQGLQLDGEAATCASVIELGPEDLVAEILAAIKAECGLSETERKN